MYHQQTRHGDNSWTEVKRRKRQSGGGRHQWDTSNGGRKLEKNRKQLTTFFFTEFPDGCDAREMYTIFKDFGDIDEVFIPMRKDKRGKWYGFVRFFNMEEARLMAIKLDNIFIGSRKIHANLPRFDREIRGSREHDVMHHRNNQGRSDEDVRHNTNTRGGKLEHKARWSIRDTNRKSYAQMVEGKYVDGQLQARKIPFVHMEYNMEEADMNQFQKAFVGVVENPGATYNIQEYFNMEGYFGVKVTPMGANLCLLEESEEGELSALIEEASDWIKQWFLEIRPWRPEDVDNERLTWLRVFGLPCHA
ncbi:uncharacterized protein LOC131598634 [Vicia villosa]|uniref:uncharacterized protein LOC131598634 n=1 Tax=Vicia villosa TaxID=3911 RepID=UPI00273B0395|nr:uncharacterized protein LOC131598634 [Vicia villosa]